jgi:hypothetical protein
VRSALTSFYGKSGKKFAKNFTVRSKNYQRIFRKEHRQDRTQPTNDARWLGSPFAALSDSPDRDRLLFAQQNRAINA